MCGRYTNTAGPEELNDRFRVPIPFSEGTHRYNVAPTEQVLAIVAPKGEPEACLLRWGLVPHWAKDPKAGARMINARAETLAKRSAYRSLLAKNRCLILADGFYEWRLDPDGKKRPVRYALDDGSPFGFAGLWTSWRDPESGESMRTCTIITTAANSLVAPVHDRMPVILPRRVEDEWLDRDVPPVAALELLRPYPSEQMTGADASMLVNSVKNDDLRLFDPAQ